MQTNKCFTNFSHGDHALWKKDNYNQNGNNTDDNNSL